MAMLKGGDLPWQHHYPSSRSTLIGTDVLASCKLVYDEAS